MSVVITNLNTTHKDEVKEQYKKNNFTQIINNENGYRGFC